MTRKMLSFRIISYTNAITILYIISVRSIIGASLTSIWCIISSISLSGLHCCTLTLFHDHTLLTKSPVCEVRGIIYSGDGASGMATRV